MSFARSCSKIEGLGVTDGCGLWDWMLAVVEGGRDGGMAIPSPAAAFVRDGSLGGEGISRCFVLAVFRMCGLV